MWNREDDGGEDKMTPTKLGACKATVYKYSFASAVPSWLLHSSGVMVSSTATSQCGSVAVTYGRAGIKLEEIGSPCVR